MTHSAVFWALASTDDLPADLNWLSSEETTKLQQFKFPKRRNEWLLGRWVSKKVLMKAMPQISSIPLPQLSIKNEESGAPIALSNGSRLSGMLSLSHREDLATAAWTSQADLRIGIDLEKIEPRSTAFIQDFFTKAEAAQVFSQPSENQALAACLIWSGKEAILKALQTGLRIDTRQVEVAFTELVIKEEDWQPLQIVHSPSSAESQTLSWLLQPPYVITLAEIADCR
ncbi:MAG: hypothetical protein BGO78_08970 [Chloroflexi bacterium 44-23]|nr:MAG: hypothetical protein BGO78_08970 [Chloroflexi bacterium 44-23]